MLAREYRHRTARRTAKASTERKSPMYPDAIPTPTTGMIRPL
jgi:hypothetical protein